MNSIIERYEAIRSRISTVAAEEKRSPEEILLLAVSKTFPVSAIAELYAHGVRNFGENRAAELCEKAAALPADICWHFIGQLQSNKVRKVVQTCQVIHSVDSSELLERIDRIAGEENKHPVILLEVSVSGEESKGGIPPEKLHDLCQRAAACSHVDLKGFMTMAPLDADEVYTAALFEKLTLLRDEESRLLQKDLPVLSMGMSGDFETAIRHGSTLVRVGTAIFGVR